MGNDKRTSEDKGWLVAKIKLELKDFFSLLFSGLVWENANEMNVHSKKFVYVQNIILMCMETKDNGRMTLQCFKIEAHVKVMIISWEFMN